MSIIVICVMCYLMSAGLVLRGLFNQNSPKRTLILVVTSIALILHAFTLQSTIIVGAGQNLSLLNIASLVGWLISLTMLIASFKVPNSIILPVVFGFTAILVVLNYLLPEQHIIQVNVEPTLLIHISFALFAYASLGMAFLYSIQLFYINLRLKEKDASILHSSLPPLMAVEQILFKLLLVGTLLLTLSLISGFVFLDNMFAKEQAHKTVLSILAWIIYSVILIGHSKFGWRGKPVITSTMVGSALLTLAYFGSRFVKEVILK